MWRTFSYKTAAELDRGDFKGHLSWHRYVGYHCFGNAMLLAVLALALWLTWSKYAQKQYWLHPVAACWILLTAQWFRKYWIPRWSKKSCIFKVADYIFPHDTFSYLSNVRWVKMTYTEKRMRLQNRFGTGMFMCTVQLRTTRQNLPLLSVWSLKQREQTHTHKKRGVYKYLQKKDGCSSINSHLENCIYPSDQKSSFNYSVEIFTDLSGVLL